MRLLGAGFPSEARHTTTQPKISSCIPPHTCRNIEILGFLFVLINSHGELILTIYRYND
jgi:hypothetical protein